MKERWIFYCRRGEYLEWQRVEPAEESPMHYIRHESRVWVKP